MLNLFYLLFAIVLEVCGDASIRLGLRGSKLWMFAGGAVLLTCYGSLVSLPNWTFGRTMGVYIAIFFLVSQIVALSVMREALRTPTIVGGILIVSGGLVILCWQPA